VRPKEFTMQIEITDIKPENDDNLMLFGKATFLDAQLHFTAMRVRKDKTFYHRAAQPEWEPELERLHALAEPDGELMTTTIPGYDGDWLVYLYPVTR